MKKSCKHGVRGNDCKFSHPPICFKWQKNGNGRGGCKNESCKYFHPKLCWQALRYRQCAKGKCSLYHVRGTKTADMIREENGIFKTENDERSTFLQENRPQYGPRPSRLNTEHRFPANNSKSDTSRGDGSDVWNHFLELKNEILRLVESVSSHAVKDNHPPTKILQRPQTKVCQCVSD